MSLQPTTPRSPRHAASKITCHEVAALIHRIMTGEPQPGTGKRAAS